MHDLNLNFRFRFCLSLILVLIFFILVKIIYFCINCKIKFYYWEITKHKKISNFIYFIKTNEKKQFKKEIIIYIKFKNNK